MNVLFNSWTSDDGKEGMLDETERVRALNTILALAAFIDQPNATPGDKDSVAEWAETTNFGFPAKEMLADPMECPPYTDPTSVLIADTASLNCELECFLPSEPTMLTGTSKTNSGTRVRFECNVSVVMIPSHHEMDPETVQSVWSTIDEVNENGLRSSLEYQADNRDWRLATEEDEMIYDADMADYIHPATWDRMQEVALEKELEEKALVRLAVAAEYLDSQTEVRQQHAVVGYNYKRTKQRRRRTANARQKNGKRSVPQRQSASLTRFSDS